MCHQHCHQQMFGWPFPQVYLVPVLVPPQAVGRPKGISEACRRDAATIAALAGRRSA